MISLWLFIDWELCLFAIEITCEYLGCFWAKKTSFVWYIYRTCSCSYISSSFLLKIIYWIFSGLGEGSLHFIIHLNALIKSIAIIRLIQKFNFVLGFLNLWIHFRIRPMRLNICGLLYSPWPVFFYWQIFQITHIQLNEIFLLYCQRIIRSEFLRE